MDLLGWKRPHWLHARMAECQATVLPDGIKIACHLNNDCIRLLLNQITIRMLGLDFVGISDQEDSFHQRGHFNIHMLTLCHNKFPVTLFLTETYCHMEWFKTPRAQLLYTSCNQPHGWNERFLWLINIFGGYYQGTQSFKGQSNQTIVLQGCT